jgi:hypothetical protein
MRLALSFEGQNLIDLLKAVSKREPFKNSGKPDRLSVNGKNIKNISDNCLEHNVIPGIEKFNATWGEGYSNLNSIILSQASCIKLRIGNNPPNTIEEILSIFAPLPWTVASFATMHLDWASAEKINVDADYGGPSIGNLQDALGWGCAFKGEGHKRLVSKRVLDYGPWHVIRDEAQDITLVQFHDIHVDSLTALEQAKPGHAWMRDREYGSLIHAEFKFYGELNGIYQPEKRKLEIVVAGRDLPVTEMVDACKARYCQYLGPEKPIDNVAFIFVLSEEDARKHLFDLWLRGLECWAFIDHLPVRLDEDYTPPPPEKPEWVKRLELSPVA